MAAMSKLLRHNVLEIAADLDRPFLIANVAHIDDVLVGVYICEGALKWHKHMDIDELFWVCDGTMLLESERGDVRLGPDELAVVPKGTRHRSSSAGRATVLLLRCGFMANRKNGNRQLYAAGRDGLPHANIRHTAETAPTPFRFYNIAQFEDSRVQIARGSGRWPVDLPVAHDRMLYVTKGSVTVRTVRDRLRLGSGDFTVVSRGAFYHLYSDQDTLLVQVTRRVL
ncbi:MAG: cupin domain-containing protein [Anaerolineae bacterium]|jgi:mannose-6-phosphate isomerase-like protein (cupin superfamily)